MRPIQALVAGITLRQTNLTTVVTKLAYSIFLSLPPPPFIPIIYPCILSFHEGQSLSLEQTRNTPPPRSIYK